MDPKLRSTIILILCLFAILFSISAWVGDDTYITMRVVDNFVHGYGLTWNTDERVQVFTHPFWMFLLIIFYVVIKEPFLTIVALSIFTAILSVALFLIKVPKTIPALILATILLGLSKSFMDFSISGLENPLTHLLLIAFLILFFQNQNIFLLSLCAGLAAFNRIDSLLLFLPSILYLLWKHRSLRTVGLVAAGFAPFLLWEVFSLVYYGFLLPNTYYAKLNTGIPASALVSQGYVYFADSLSRDTITLVVIALALGIAFIKGQTRERLVASGIILYLAYILYIGGDFMSGRFFSAPYVAAVFLLIQFLPTLDMSLRGGTSLAPMLFSGFRRSNLSPKQGVASGEERKRPRNDIIWIASAIFLVMGCLVPLPTFVLPTVADMEQSIRDFESSKSILDIKARAFQTSSLVAWMKNTKDIFPDEKVARRGDRYRAQGTRVAVDGTVGLIGFFGGPHLHLIDGYALGDPLLARLPAVLTTWKIAHFPRLAPDGYIETFETGINQIKDPDVALYYDKLHFIVSGDLWTWERWKTIWEFNTGQYDYLLNSYRESLN